MPVLLIEENEEDALRIREMQVETQNLAIGLGRVDHLNRGLP